MARFVSTKSKDPSTKVGAVVVGSAKQVLSIGYNGFPRGVVDEIPSRWERPGKYLRVSHAEENCVFNAARSGISLEGATMYMQFAPGPCAACARAIIQAGIARVVVDGSSPFPGKGSQWEESIAISLEMLNEAGVELLNIVSEKT